VNEHLSPRARTVVACIGLKQRAKGLRHFLDACRRDPSAHHFSAALFHARALRERAELASRDAQLDAAGVPAGERGSDARRMG
jgi:hypothetical protein